MKLVHNVRIRVHEADAEAAGHLLNQIMRDAGLTHEDVHIAIGYDPVQDATQGELWADHQQPVRKLVSVLQQELPEADRTLIATNPGTYLDTGTRCFLLLEKTALREGTYRLAGGGESAQVRLNLAAFPATRENALRILRQLF